MTMILGLSHHITGHSGFHADVSHHRGLGVEHTANVTCHKETVTAITLLLHKALMLMIHTYQHGCVRCHTSGRFFTCDTRFLHAGTGLKNIFPH